MPRVPVVILKYFLGKGYMDRKERKNKREGVGSHEERLVGWW